MKVVVIEDFVRFNDDSLVRPKEATYDESTDLYSIVEDGEDGCLDMFYNDPFHRSEIALSREEAVIKARKRLKWKFQDLKSLLNEFKENEYDVKF